MHLLSVVFLVVSANIDSLFISLSYRIRNIHISFQNNLIITFLTTLGTYLSMVLGSYCQHLFSLKIANEIGAFLLILIGFIMMIQSHHEEHTYFIATDLSLKQALFLGLTLSINNLGLSFSGSLTGLPCLFTCLMTFIVSCCFIFISQMIGQLSLFHCLEHYAPFLTSLLILFIGLYEFFF